MLDLTSNSVALHKLVITRHHRKATIAPRYVEQLVHLEFNRQEFFLRPQLVDEIDLLQEPPDFGFHCTVE